jgi:uncharacterized protein (DUF885 family)
LRALHKIPRKSLNGEDALNYDLAERQLKSAIEGFKYPSQLLVLDHMGGLQIDLADMMNSMPVSTKKNYRDRIARLEKIPDLEFQVEALLREGLKRKVTPLKVFLERVPPQFEKVLTPKIEDSPLYMPFKDIRAAISGNEKQELRQKAVAVLKDKVYPAMQKLRDFVVDEYIPGARTSTAWRDMPDGANWYAYLVREHTATSMQPEELHQMGLKEVARILGEMEKIRDQVKFKGDLKSFNQHLLADPKYYYTDPQALLTAYRDLAKRIDPELPRLFKTLPRLPYGVREIAAYKAKDAPAAYYEPGSPGTGRAGYFEANTTDLQSRPKWAMEALTMHEAVPGHHLQLAIAAELENVPEFRKHERDAVRTQTGVIHYTAFVEGWGLYAEGLADELGFAKDPYSKYGQLSYEMWRAVRLVVDTGMHQLGWSRDQAIEYFMDHLPKTRLEAEQEVDRYLTMPGQALAYKVGQMKFRELRDYAKAQLGDKFDIRTFHDEVLRHGAVPMDVLEKTVKAWTAVQKKRK